MANRHKWSDLRAQLPAKDLKKLDAKRSTRREEKQRNMPLYELRHARAMSQEAIAEALQTSQSSVSKLERRVDIYVSSLRRYIESLGGELEIIARFPDGDVRINQFEGIGPGR
jgi:DNA-binding transcriptional regulator YiaG